MFRLRTTTGLSLLALAIGIAGTGWLSTLTAGWAGPSRHASRPAAVHATTRPVHHATARRQPRWHGPVSVVGVRRHARHNPAPDAAVRPVPELVPLAMPHDRSMSYDQLRGHLDGHVVLRVAIDGGGRVSHADIADSSGDPVLDAYVLRSVHGWRFATSPDFPNGWSAELPVRFSSQDGAVAGVP